MTIVLFDGPRFIFAEIKCSDGGQHRIATGQSVALIAVEEGRVGVNSDGKWAQLDQQYCGLYVSNSSVEIIFSKGISLTVLSCSAPCTALSLLRDAPSYFGQSLTTKTIATLLRVGCGLADARSHSEIRLRDTIGDAAVQAFLAETETPLVNCVPEFLKRARSYIDEHFAEPVHLPRLAHSAGVTKEHLVGSFKRHFGITPIRYLWDLRTRKAAELVRTTAMPLADIAQQCGYKSQYHLSREIKRATGASPRELRYKARLEIASPVA